jgi:uncharacterized cupin superfamily protein
MQSSLLLHNIHRIPDERLTDRGPAIAPLGDVVSRLSSLRLAEDREASREIGIWECTPGRWPRQQMAAEFTVFLSGHCRFEPENGAEVEIKPGDVLYFPANTKGIWDITETVRKVYMIMK